jgi:type II secretion system protein N
VKPLSKAILIGVASLIGLAVLLLLALNLYLQSPGTQARIQRELSDALKLPLVITNTTITPWSDLRINGITVPGENGNFLEAASFSARYKLIPLLRKQLVIYDMRFQSPRVRWVQNAKGKWVLPRLAQAPQAAAEEEAEKKEKKPKAKKSDFEIVLAGFKIQGGSIEFIDQDDKRVALLDDVDLDYTVITEERVEGTARIGRVNYADALFFENVRSPFTYAGEEFTLPRIEATLGGGSVTGSFDLKPTETKSPFVAQLEFANVDLAQVTTAAGWASGRASGALAGNISLKGPSRQVEKAEGQGHLTLTNGVLRQMDLLQTLGEVLQLDELIQLRLTNATTDFHLGGEKIHIDRLLLESPDLKLSATGTARFNRKLELDARLSVDEATLKRRAPFVRNLFASTDESGQHAIDFKVGGTWDRPTTDLAEKLLGKTLGDQFENVVSRLFGLGKKKDEEKKKEEKEKKNKKKEGREKVSPAPPPPPTEPAASPPTPSPAAPAVPLQDGAPAGAEPAPAGRPAAPSQPRGASVSTMPQ